ncbi:uncharacterized protein LOC131332223 [Rhododendron vialii]|uniref:uncharacterized protein LOC131332223 n=1 Tax=Rhododendron vialii TaxID=182163 RepID=UPI00266025D3|nr:uncharacterized protein LOC131332223 [Rhododendron vialii]
MASNSGKPKPPFLWKFPPNHDDDESQDPSCCHLLPLTQISTNIPPILTNPSCSQSSKKPLDSTIHGSSTTPKVKASISGKENPGFNSKTHFTPLLAKPSIIYSPKDSAARASNDEDYGFAAAYADCGLDSIESTVEDIVSPPDTTTTSKCFSEGKGLDQRGVCYPSNSLESRLLKSIVRDSFSNDEETGEESEEEHCTQLDVLLKLCSEKADDDRSNRSEDFSAACVRQHCGVGDSLVHCPLCGADISCLSDELRQVHTNDCLDKEEAPDVVRANNDVQPHCHGQVVNKSPIKACRQNTDVHPVLEWLRNLGLARYEEIFVQEEIDWDTLQWLTEEDLFSMGVTALGPRKKIVHALSELRKQSTNTAEIRTDACRDAIDETSRPAVNKLITDFFPGSVGHRRKDCTSSSERREVERSPSNAGRKHKVVKKNIMHKKLRDIPQWCQVPGTPFRVDAFKYLRRDCSHWFLTHFHIDHYQGLSRSFSHGKIYCSLITARLVNMKIGIPWDKLEVLPINQKISISGIDVTCFDANHCPGSILILFESPSGKAVLHTGDFRFCENMTKISVLQTSRVQTLILDTTYCNPQYDFPKQEDVIQFVIEAIEAEAFNPETLFLIGSYTVGKERLFLEVARVLRKKVYVPAAKLRLLECLGLSVEDMRWFTLNEEESHIHVVPMWTLASFKRLKCISSQYARRFSLIVAFSPTGWTFGKGKKKSSGRRWQQGTIVRYEVPYSEHCSFTELKEFVKFISPENIVPSVNNDGPESANAMVSLLLS